MPSVSTIQPPIVLNGSGRLHKQLPDIDNYAFDSADSEDESDSPESLETTSSTYQEYFAAEMQDLAQERGHK